MQPLQRMQSQRSQDHQAQLVFRPQSLTVISPFRRVMTPVAPLSEFFLELIDPHGSQVAIEDCLSGQRMTFEQLSHGIRQAASGLFHLGVRAGDVVAFCVPAVPEVVVLMQAIGLLGAVWTVLPLPSQNHGADGKSLDRDTLDSQRQSHRTDDLWMHILVDSKARFLVTIPPWLGPLANLWLRVSPHHPISDIICIGDSPSDASNTSQPGISIRAFADLFQLPAFFPDQPAQDPNDVLALVYVDSQRQNHNTESKPLPKGIQFSHAALLAMLVQSLAADDLQPHDVVLSTSPLHHPQTFSIQLLVPLSRGSRLLLVSDPSYLTRASDALHLLDRHRPSRIYMSPELAESLVADQERQNAARLDNLEVVVGCGSVFPRDLCQRMHSAWGVSVRQMYGHPETILTHGILAGSQTDPLANVPPPPNTIGQLLPNVECRVLNHVTRQPCFINQPGDIYIKSPNCFSGYRDHSSNQGTDKDGWIRTGDFGFFDRRGFFFLLPRPGVH